jgi:transcription antitermination factor NusG
MNGAGELVWYALRTLPMREDMVKKLLIYRGLKAFTKTQKVYGRWTNGKRKEREAVAAPGYVFIGTTGNPWMEVHRCHMIRSVVSLEGRPVRLNPEALGAFLDLPDESLPDYFRFFREAPFAIGDMVRIDAPAFEGFELRVKDIQRHEAIFDLVWNSCQPTEVRFPVSQCFKSQAA